MKFKIRIKKKVNVYSTQAVTLKIGFFFFLLHSLCFIQIHLKPVLLYNGGLKILRASQQQQLPQHLLSYSGQQTSTKCNLVINQLYYTLFE